MLTFLYLKEFVFVVNRHDELFNLIFISYALSGVPLSAPTFHPYFQNILSKQTTVLMC